VSDGPRVINLNVRSRRKPWSDALARPFLGGGSSVIGSRSLAEDLVGYSPKEQATGTAELQIPMRQEGEKIERHH
jgi:hypothetical protein